VLRQAAPGGPATRARRTEPLSYKAPRRLLRVREQERPASADAAPGAGGDAARRPLRPLEHDGCCALCIAVGVQQRLHLAHAAVLSRRAANRFRVRVPYGAHEDQPALVCRSKDLARVRGSALHRCGRGGRAGGGGVGHATGPTAKAAAPAAAASRLALRRTALVLPHVRANGLSEG